MGVKMELSLFFYFFYQEWTYREVVKYWLTGELNKKQQWLLGCLVLSAVNELKKKIKKTMKRGIMSSNLFLFPILFSFAFLSSPVLSASDLILAKVDRRVSLLISLHLLGFRSRIL